MQFKGATVSATISLMLALSACSATPDVPVDLAPSGEPVVLAPNTPPDAIREAAIGGIVDLADGCFFLEDERHTMWLVEWPYGTTLGADSASVENGAFGVVRAGDTIEGGGGYGDAPVKCGSMRFSGVVSFDALESSH